jgi:hypothetical protein
MVDVVEKEEVSRTRLQRRKEPMIASLTSLFQNVFRLQKITGKRNTYPNRRLCSQTQPQIYEPEL